MNEENDIILTIQGVVYRQSEMDTPARLRAFNNLIVLESEAVKLDDRRIYHSDFHKKKLKLTSKRQMLFLMKRIN